MGVVVVSTHRCPECGGIHWVPTPIRLCATCGHPDLNHNDDGGKRKKAYCTVWTQGMKAQCECADFVEKEKADVRTG